MQILDGLAVRDSIAARLKQKIKKSGGVPALAIIQVGKREDSNAYIARKKQFAEEIGAKVFHLEFPDNVSEGELAQKIAELNADKTIHGIILQMPLPKHLDENKLIDLVSPQKDVDGLTSTNMKLLLENKSGGFLAATAKGVLSLLDFYKIEIEGKRVVVVGRSATVGKPIALSFLNRDATVTVAHSRTPNLEAVTREADILVSVVGKAKFIGAKYVQAGQGVIDVGINPLSPEKNLAERKPEDEIPKRRIVGDVDFDSVKDIVSAITPVPGGVGPMTVASLFENLVEAFEHQSKTS